MRKSNPASPWACSTVHGVAIGSSLRYCLVTVATIPGRGVCSREIPWKAHLESTGQGNVLHEPVHRQSDVLGVTIVFTLSQRHR